MLTAEQTETEADTVYSIDVKNINLQIKNIKKTIFPLL